MKLSKECIEAIGEAALNLAIETSSSPSDWTYIAKYIIQGAAEALTNPSIFEKAGLISLEGFELLITKMFLQYEAAQCIALTTGEKFQPSEWLKNQIQIYQQQKEK